MPLAELFAWADAGSLILFGLAQITSERLHSPPVKDIQPMFHWSLVRPLLCAVN